MDEWYDLYCINDMIYIVYEVCFILYKRYDLYCINGMIYMV